MSRTILQESINGYSDRLLKEEADRQNPRKTNPLLASIRARLERKQDARVIIAGEGGVGKSTLALDLGEDLNPDLYVNNIDRAVGVGVSFVGKQFLDGVRTLPSLSVLDFDEPAQGMYHRQFMTEVNMILSKTFIGFRYKKFVSELSVPNIDLLDIDAVKLANYFIWVDSQGHSTVYRILPSRFGGDPYFKVIVDSMTFRRPGKELWEKYEARKFANQDNLYETFDKRLEELNAPKLTMSEMVDMIVEHPEKFSKQVQGKDEIHYSKIQEEFGVGVNRGYTLKHMAVGRLAKKKAEETEKSANQP